MREKWLDASFDQLSRATSVNLSTRGPVMKKNIAPNTASIQSARLSVLSVEIGSPTPSPASVCYSSPYGSKGGNALACVGWGGGGGGA
jgi:hypothetical protein